MAANNARLESTFVNNARFYAPEHLTRQLQALVSVEDLAMIVDIDALDRSTFARRDRVMMLALDALSHARVEIILASRGVDRADTLRRGIPRARCVQTDRALLEIRERAPETRVIAVTDDRQLLEALGPNDRGMTFTRASAANVVVVGEISVRAVLWWLVGERA